MGAARRVFLLAVVVLAAGGTSLLSPLSAGARSQVHGWRAKTAEAEEGAAGKAEEEAANKAEEEAAARRVPKLTITSVKVSSSALLLSLDLSRPGSVTVTGPGLSRTVKTFTALTGELRVALTATGRKEFKQHRKITVAANIRVADSYGYATKLVKL